MDNEREQISKKLRFEIFKRDNFVCQYCGGKAPEVVLKVLRVDHITPVCKGGDNNILNLITSCFDCNSGKGGRTLSDHTVLDKQRKQLEDLEERRQQIEMMMEWHDSLQDIGTLKLDKVISYLNDKISPYTLNKTGTEDVAKATKKYELLEILEAIDTTFDYYLEQGRKQFERDRRSFENYKLPKLKELVDRKCYSLTSEKFTKANELEIELNRMKTKLEGLRLEREDKTGSEKSSLTSKMTNLRSDISRIQRQFDKLFFTAEDEKELKELKESNTYFEDPNTHKELTISLFLSKFPGILRNKKREREDPDYRFILEIYQTNKNFGYGSRDYGFAFTSIEKLYKKLRLHNVKPAKCVALMCYKEWSGSKEMIAFIEEKLNYFPLDLSNPPC